jgi:hypothetical protein
MGDITSANSVLMIGAGSVYPSAQQIQDFAADDIFDIENLRVGEIMIGVDGKLSAGFVFEPVMQTIRLMAGSTSGVVFDTIYQYERTNVLKVQLNAVFKFPSLGITFTSQKGYMTTYKPMSDARKILQPRSFAFAWESFIAAPIVGV